ncbi:MAG: ribosomal-protein-alanine N-acetyltransferase [Thermoplasmata archaeon]|nr:GNAT family N-acetyltransferase [Euryarchaeota archaeon]RLF64522.1 MAG: ribosomal-protein-alanine N-acetyltransferase [Thermoplasmata archaeon]
MKSKGIKIREARDNDLMEMLSMLAEEGIYHNEELYVLLYENYPDLMLIAEEDGKLVGFVIGSLSTEESGRILVLFVKKDYRGRGVGKALMKEILRRFLVKYCVKEVTLEVHEKNETAIKLYEKLGFRKVRKLYKYYDGEDGWLMVKRLVP